MNRQREYFAVIGTGLVTGIAAVLLFLFGNPENMGFCIACFLRDIAGALGFHGGAVVQNYRPEIVGIVLGALLMSLCRKEFRGSGGSSPVTRFFLGGFVMIGALMFLGCPLRMMIRLGGGDLSAIAGLFGFAAGIGVGVLFLKLGFTLKRSHRQSAPEGLAFPVVFSALFALSVFVPSLFFTSVEGPGSLTAPLFLSLGCGLVVGALAQRSRFCMAGGIRDALLFRDFHLLTGLGAVLISVFIGNFIVRGGFQFVNPGAIAHNDFLWNFLGMALVGWLSVLLGGCPLRQLVLAGSGSSDSAIAVLGMMFGAALCHNFSLASSAQGPTGNGKIAVLIGFGVALLVSLLNLKRTEASQ